MIHVVLVVGTRPEAIKMAPVARAMGRQALACTILLTGQHAGLASSEDWGAVPLTDAGIDPRGLDPEEMRICIRDAVRTALRQERPDLVLVQGDTMSALAGAEAARDLGIAIGHVEAGLRSFDLTQPFPEERNRVAIDALASFLFAPTEVAARNLQAEDAVTGTILVTGNTGIDALFHARRHAPVELPGEADRKPILATCHRRENQGGNLRDICDAFRALVRGLPVRIVLPVHPNRHLRAAIEEALGGEPHIHLIEPAEHPRMVRLLESCWLVLTDSGGLQEEAPAIGRPALVLRNVTERQEAVATGNLELVGTDPGRIFSAVEALLLHPERYRRMAVPTLPFGDGRAAERIVAAIEHWAAERQPQERLARNS